MSQFGCFRFDKPDVEASFALSNRIRSVCWIRKTEEGNGQLSNSKDFGMGRTLSPGATKLERLPLRRGSFSLVL